MLSCAAAAWGAAVAGPNAGVEAGVGASVGASRDRPEGCSSCTFAHVMIMCLERCQSPRGLGVPTRAGGSASTAAAGLAAAPAPRRQGWRQRLHRGGRAGGGAFTAHGAHSVPRLAPWRRPPADCQQTSPGGRRVVGSLVCAARVSQSFPWLAPPHCFSAPAHVHTPQSLAVLIAPPTRQLLRPSHTSRPLHRPPHTPRPLHRPRLTSTSAPPLPHLPSPSLPLPAPGSAARRRSYAFSDSSGGEEEEEGTGDFGELPLAVAPLRTAGSGGGASDGALGLLGKRG
eukprot:317397-Chlamydomonas_euryale.AAC.1